MKIFISHSSADKAFAETMIESIGRDSVIFDKYSFEPGENLNQSIIDSINNCDLFVLLISNEALNSKWVQEEIKIASGLMLPKGLVFLPYCIDSTITPKDTRLEEWVWDKLVKLYDRPKLAARAIRRKLNEKIVAKFPDIYFADNLFVGRNIDMSNLEKNHYREDLTKLKVLFISGFPFVGRKTVHKKFISQYIVNKPSYQPITLRLSSTDSIEHLAIQLNEYVGLIEESKIFDFISQGTDIVITLLNDLINETIKAQEKIIIEDDACIVKAGGSIIDWFLDLLRKINLPSEIIFYISSRFRPSPSYVASNPMLMEYPLGTLHRDEMYSLFKHCLNIKGLSLADEEINAYVDSFTGYPKQAIDAAALIKEHNPVIAKTKISAIKQSYDGNYHPIWDELSNDSRDLLILMSKFDFINTELLVDIYKGKNIAPLLEEIETYSLYETFGQSNEYLCLCPAFSDFITRMRYKLSDDVKQIFRRATKSMLENMDTELTDISSNLFAIKELVRSNPKGVKEKYLIPSFVLKVIVEEYHLNHDGAVVNIASRIIADYKKVNYDSCINSIHYWLCCSLCRLQDRDRFETEVRYFENDEFDMNYLYGFYYRHNNKKSSLRKALQYYEYAASKKDERDYKTITTIAKVEHELVIVMMKLRDFAGAISKARINYENNSHNSYHIRAYYNCLIHSSSRTKEDLILLLDKMESLGTRAILQFLPTMRAQYEFYVNDNFTQSVTIFRETFKRGLSDGMVYAIEAFRDICNLRGASVIFDNIMRENNINASNDIDEQE